MAKGTNTTRRSVLAGLAVLPGATAMAGGEPVGSPNVLHLIEAHRKAHEHLNVAVSARERILDDLERKSRGVLRLVPLGIAPDGTCMGGKFEYGEFDRETIMGKIADHHARGSEWVRAMFPDLAVPAQAALDASMARAIGVLDDFDAAAAAEREASGLADAERASEMAYRSEEHARLELLLCMPENDEQAAMKREYVMGCDLFDSILLDDGFVELMIDRLCPAAA